MCFQLCSIYPRHAKKLIAVTADRAVRLARGGCYRRDPAVSYSVVVDIFIRQPQLPIRAERNREIGVPGVTFTADEIAVTVQIFVNCIQPHSDCITQRRI